MLRIPGALKPAESPPSCTHALPAPLTVATPTPEAPPPPAWPRIPRELLGVLALLVVSEGSPLTYNVRSHKANCELLKTVVCAPVNLTSGSPLAKNALLSALELISLHPAETVSLAPSTTPIE